MAPRHRYAGYEDDNQGVVQMLASYTKNPIVLAAMGLVAFLAVTSDATVLFDLIYGEKDQRYQGRLPHSLLTLNYPFTLLRGVVKEQPVEASDVPFFWHPHKVDAAVVQKILTSCYGVETIDLDSLESIKKAKDVNLASRRGSKFAITSPFIREVAEIFTPEHLGRSVCFFRHPLDFDLHDQLPKFEEEDNWMIRFLLGTETGELGNKDLGQAKQVIRDICVAVTSDKLATSIKRAADYFGWTMQGSESCVEDSVHQSDTQERHLDHDSDEWKRFYAQNRYDCQLYELAQQTWRAQIQTIIPLSLQLSRAKQFDNEEEEGAE